MVRAGFVPGWGRDRVGFLPGRTRMSQQSLQPTPILEATQGKILSQPPTDATSGGQNLNESWVKELSICPWVVSGMERATQGFSAHFELKTCCLVRGNPPEELPQFLLLPTLVYSTLFSLSQRFPLIPAGPPRPRRRGWGSGISFAS